MSRIIHEVKKELKKLEKVLDAIKKFRQQEPEGCLKYQKKGKKILYYQQYKNEKTGLWER